MKLTKFEQSGFIIETENRFRLAFDIGNKTPIEKLDGIKPVDLMIISHIHGDHFSPVHISALFPKTIILPKECHEVLYPNSLGLPYGAPKAYKLEADFVMSSEGLIYENESVKISFFHVDHGPNISMPIDNYGFVIEADEQKIYFAGDMFYPSGVNVSDLEVDYVLIPVGGFYTYGPEEAFAFAKQFKTIKNLVPIHEVPKPESVQEFVELAGKEFNVVVM